MNISWGTKIAILYIGFVILIITMVSKAMHQKVDLVSADYYEQELKYQDKIDRTKRTQELNEQLSWNVEAHSIRFKFPEELKGQRISGTIYFFRPSDEAMDKTIRFSSVDPSLIFEVTRDQLKKGLYKMQVNWKTDEKEYYNEGVLNF